MKAPSYQGGANVKIPIRIGVRAAFPFFAGVPEEKSGSAEEGIADAFF